MTLIPLVIKALKPGELRGYMVEHGQAFNNHLPQSLAACYLVFWQHL